MFARTKQVADIGIFIYRKDKKLAKLIAVQACVVTEQQVIERFFSSPAEDTFADLYRAFSPRVFVYFLIRCGDRGVAEELTQDVMLAVFRQARQLRDPGRFRIWLFKIALNAWRKHLRSHNHDVVTIAMDLVAELSATGADPLADSCFAAWMAMLAPDERGLMTIAIRGRHGAP